jgi:signal transduction histidine kinase
VHPFEVLSSPCEAVHGDPQLLLQLVANLLDNAVRHTPPGTPIELSAAMTGDRPTIVVADQGPGVVSTDREKVFRRFYRCEQSRTTPGSGLGLTLAQAIADLHDAEISLRDNNPGLKVVVMFPAAARDHAPRRTVSQAAGQVPAEVGIL